MRIGVDVREFKKGAYTGIRNILKNFFEYADVRGKHELVLFCDQYTDQSSLPDHTEKVVISDVNTFVWDQWQLPNAIKKKGIDVFFSPYIKTPLWRACPCVHAIYDIIPLKVPKRGGVMAFLEKAYFFIYAFLCSRRAVSVITLSKSAKKDILEKFHLDTRKVEIIYPSVEVGPEPNSLEKEDERIVKRYGLETPYILYIGNFKTHKNVYNLLSAYELLPEELKDDYNLMLVGGSEGEAAAMDQVISEKGLSEKVVAVRGGMDRKEIRVFLKHAALFVFPSLVEGFGIPPVEAMASGVPVAASRFDPMPEVLGDAALFFDPEAPEDISGVIRRLLTDMDARQQCINKGRERVSLFDPEEMARRMLDVLEDAGRERTLLVSSDLPPVTGGIATYLANLWGRLPSEDITILTAKAAEEGAAGDLDKKGNIIRESYPLGSDMFARIFRTACVIWYVWGINRSRNIRRNHCAQVISAGLAGLLMKKLHGVPYIVYAYSADILEFSRNFLTKWIMEKVIAGSERVIVCSQHARSVIVGHRLASKEKVTVITPGVDTARLDPGKGQDDIRKKYGIPEGKKVLLTVSRLAPRKGHEDIINILPGILEKYKDCVYVIVGGGDKRAQLEELVRKNGLEENVIFTGEVPEEDITFLYNTCDIFIMIPRYIAEAGDVEGFGIVFLEANACGKPVVAGKSGGVPEAVIDENTGILVEPGDEAGINDAVLRLLRDEEYARELGNNGLSRIREKFTWENRAEELKKYI